jgi:hypothetical protein
MPSPFPGMDPYLEDPAGWPNLHLNLVAEINATLNRDLRPKYFARAEERVYVSDLDDPGRRVIAPDVRVLASPIRHSEDARLSTRVESAAVADPITATTWIAEDIREPRVEIIDAADRRVITVIDIVSPANKVRDSRGRESYRRKRAEVMTSQTHWVEVDLLREGQAILAKELLPPADYLVHVSPVRRRPSGLIWPILLPQRLPIIEIPLQEGDSSYRLDLQQILATVYDRSSYDLSVDYASDPRPPLPEHYAEWSRRLLCEKGVREG